METLTSLKNPKVAVWRSLKDKKGREEQPAFLVEGVRIVREALESSFPVRAVLLREDFRPDYPVPEDKCFLLPDAVISPFQSEDCPLFSFSSYKTEHLFFSVIVR